jgi:hypothetical protein
MNPLEPSLRLDARVLPVYPGPSCVREFDTLSVQLENFPVNWILVRVEFPKRVTKRFKTSLKYRINHYFPVTWTPFSGYAQAVELM